MKTIKIRVKPNSRKFRIEKKNDLFLIELRSSPKGNKANMELVKELKKHFKKDVIIVKGFKSREKYVVLY